MDTNSVLELAGRERSVPACGVKERARSRRPALCPPRPEMTLVRIKPFAVVFMAAALVVAPSGRSAHAADPLTKLLDS